MRLTWHAAGLDGSVGRLRRDIRMGKVYLVSRRCTRRQFLLSPNSTVVEQLFWYWLGYAALLTGVQVSAVCVMSDHYHLVIVDRFGRLSDFLHALDRNLACALSVFRGWSHEVFDKSQASAVELVSAEAIIKALSYTTGNGSTSFAVRYSEQWPGAMTRVRDLGERTILAKKLPYWSLAAGRRNRDTGRIIDPDEIWNATDEDAPVVKGGWPHTVEFEIGWPQELMAEMKPREARKRVAQRVRDNERRAWQEARDKGWSFGGAKRARRQPHTRRARSWETFGSLNPRFSAAGDLEVAQAVVARNTAFDAEYDKALFHWQYGDRRRAVFPYGTWKMRVVHNARCRPPP